jgi:hypothetical protein
MEGLIETLLEVFCDSPDIGDGGCDEVDGRNIGERWS